MKFATGCNSDAVVGQKLLIFPLLSRKSEFFFSAESKVNERWSDQGVDEGVKDGIDCLGASLAISNHKDSEKWLKSERKVAQLAIFVFLKLQAARMDMSLWVQRFSNSFYY